MTTEEVRAALRTVSARLETLSWLRHREYNSVQLMWLRRDVREEAAFLQTLEKDVERMEREYGATANISDLETMLEEEARRLRRYLDATAEATA